MRNTSERVGRITSEMPRTFLFPCFFGLPDADIASPSLIEPTLSESFPAFGGASFPFSRAAAAFLGLAVDSVAGAGVDDVGAGAGEGESEGSVLISVFMAGVPSGCFFDPPYLRSAKGLVSQTMKRR